MLYEKLLLNCDGGIIDIAQQCEMDNCAVVCIGLGGTGIECLQNLKAKIYNRVRPDNPGSVVPKYSRIKFLAVDTDKSGLKRANDNTSEISRIDLDSEFHDISYDGDIVEFFKEHGKVLENDPVYNEWLRHKDIKVLAARAGAGGVRQVGRYLFMQKAFGFVETVRNLVQQAKADKTSPKTYVHIFTGVSGGTGAGVLLDVCYLVRMALRGNDNAFVCGYCFLPDVNISKGLDAETTSYIEVNGYATLQELDYCMNFERNGDKWSQSYKGLDSIETNVPPFDICHLVTARDAKGNVKSNGYNYAVNVVTDYFMDFIVKTDNNFTLESHISNFSLKKEQVYKQHGALYEYCVLGASNARLPYKEVLTYLAARVFENFADIKKNLPGEMQFEEFLAENRIRYGDIEAMLTQGCDMAFPMPVANWHAAKQNALLVSRHYGGKKNAVLATVEANYTALSKEIDEKFSPAQQVSASVVRPLAPAIYTALRSEALNPEKGPYYAAALLSSNSVKDLMAEIDGQLLQVKNTLNQYNAASAELREKLATAKSAFFDNNGFIYNLLFGRSNYKLYCRCQRDFDQNETFIAIYTKLQELLTNLRMQLTRLSSDFFNVFRSTVQNLMDTFDANKKYLEDISDGVTDFEMPIARINDLTDTLNQTIKNMNMSAKLQDFLTNLLSDEGIDAWIDGNENKIFTVVNRYFTDLFSEYSQKTMTSYLQDKYGTNDTNRLIKRIRDDIMNTLDNKATPLFWSSTVYNLGDASRIGYITFPAVSAEVFKAAEQLSDAKQPGELTTRSSSIQDRISIMRCLVGVPLFGYQGLLQYENNSILSSAVGKHLYEGKNYTLYKDRYDKTGKYVTGRDWRYLPSPTSLSVMNERNCAILRDNAEKAKKLYELAEEKRVIAQTDGNNYGIYIIEDSFVEEIRQIDRTVKGKTKVEFLTALGEIEEMMKNVRYKPDRIHIPNDATPSLPENNKRDVRIDHFVSSPKLHDIVMEELKKVKEIETITENLKPKEDNDLIEFQNALFTGVIKLTPPVVEFEDDYGTQFKLSSPEMKRGGIPIYQAFLNFKELDGETRSFIRTSMAQRLETLPFSSEGIENSKEVKKELTNLKFFVRVASEEFPSEVGFVKAFLNGMDDALTRFAGRYRFSI